MSAAPGLLESNVNPRDTSPSANQKLVHELNTYPVNSSITWLFKNSLPKAELAVFWVLSHLSFSLPGPAINLSLLQTPTFQSVWPPCGSGTRTCTHRGGEGASSLHWSLAKRLLPSFFRHTWSPKEKSGHAEISQGHIKKKKKKKFACLLCFYM